MRPRISIRGSVHPSFRPSDHWSVHPSIGPSVRLSVTRFFRTLENAYFRPLRWMGLSWWWWGVRREVGRRWRGWLGGWWWQGGRWWWRVGTHLTDVYIAELITCDWAAAVRHDARSHEIIYLCTLYSICFIFISNILCCLVYMYFLYLIFHIWWDLVQALEV